MGNEQKRLNFGFGIIISIMLIFAFVFTLNCVFAQADTGETSSDGLIKIEGECKYEKEGSVITLIVTANGFEWDNEEEWLNGSGDNIAYYGEYTVGSDRTYSFNFKLSEPGVYNAYIASATAGVEKSQIVYIDEDKNNQAIQAALNAADADALKSAIENNLADLGVFAFEAADLDDDAAEILFNELEDRTSIEPDDMRILTEKTILISKINSGELNSFYDYPELNLLNDTIFEHCTEDIAADVADEMGKTEITSVSAFDTSIIESTILALANTRDGAVALRSALLEYAAELGITKTITDDMCQSLIKASSFANYDAVEKAIADYKKDDGGGGTGNGNGNSGGVSFGGGTSSNRYDGTESVTDGTENEKPEEIAPFDDIADVEWAATAISELYKQKVINGKAERLFFPMDPVTREEFAKILMLAFDVNLVDAECPFSDVSEDDWSYRYVRTAYLAGVVKGIDETTFGKELNITRQDLCVMVYRLLTTGKPELENPDAVSAFIDTEEIADYAVEAVGFMQENGIITGDESGRFNPGAPSTRAEAVKIVYNAMLLYQQG